MQDDSVAGSGQHWDSIVVDDVTIGMLGSHPTELSIGSPFNPTTDAPGVTTLDTGC